MLRAPAVTVPDNSLGIVVGMVRNIAVVVLMIIGRGVSMGLSVIGICMSVDMGVINTGMVMRLRTGMHVNVVRMVMRTHVPWKGRGDQSALGPQHP